MNDRTNWESINWFLQQNQIELLSPYNTGFNTWEIKKNLYRLRDRLDSMIEVAPTYAGEQEWLQERNVDKAVSKLSK